MCSFLTILRKEKGMCLFGYVVHSEEARKTGHKEKWQMFELQVVLLHSLVKRHEQWEPKVDNYMSDLNHSVYSAVAIQNIFLNKRMYRDVF